VFSHPQIVRSEPGSVTTLL